MANPTRVRKVACPECGNKVEPASREGHKENCPNGACLECKATTGHLLNCSRNKQRRRATVDGAESELRTGPDPKPAENGRAQRTAPPPILDGDMYALVQEAYNDGKIAGIAQPKTSVIPCTADWTDEQGPVGCSARAIFRHVDERECPTCHTIRREKQDEFCLAHTAMHLAGNSVHAQMAMPL